MGPLPGAALARPPARRAQGAGRPRVPGDRGQALEDGAEEPPRRPRRDGPGRQHPAPAPRADRAQVPRQRGPRRLGRQGAPRAARPREPRHRRPLPDARRPLGGRVRGPGAGAGLHARLQPLDRRLLPRRRRPPRPHRAPLPRHPRGGGARARARGARRREGHLHRALRDDEETPGPPRPRSRLPPRRGDRPPDRHPPRLRALLGGARPLRAHERRLARLPHQRDRAGRRAPRLHLVLPVRRVREVPAPQGGGARVGRGLDRLLARAHGRGLRLAARAQRALEGEAELLLPPPVLDLVRPRRALARGRDPAGRRAALLLGLGLPAPRPSARVREAA